MKAAKILTTVLLAIATILFFVGYGLSDVAGKERDHDLGDIQVRITDMTPKQGDYGYRLYFDYLIKNGSSEELSSVYTVVDFCDRNGKSLGKITTDFDQLDLKSGDKTTLQAYISYNQSSNDDLFVKLYNDGLDDLTVTCSVTSASWIDGYWQFDRTNE